MKRIFTSGLLLILHPHFHLIGREYKNIFNARRITVLLFVLTSLLPGQSIVNKYIPNPYNDVYIWKEKENTFPANDSILTVLGRWAWGPCYAADIKNNFAYIGNGPTFHILDLSDPSNPEIYGEYLTDGYINDIEVRDNTAFVCIGRGLLILDITDPSAPKKLSFVDMSAGYLALEGSFAYVTSFSAVRVVDISDLNNPFLRGGISAGGERVACVEAKGGYVYVGNPEWPDLEIVDATNPDSLTAAFFDIGGMGLSAFIKDTLLFVGVSYISDYLKIYSLSDLAEPEFLGQVEFEDSVFINGITVSDDGQTSYVISSTWEPGIEGVYSIDISNLSQPVILDKFKRANQSGGLGISLSYNMLVAAYSSGLGVLDISDPGNLQFKSFFPTGWIADKIQLKDSLAFVGSGLAGLWILDVTNPAKPKAVSNVNTNSFTSDLVVEDTLVYIVNWAAYSREDSSRGLWVIDISNIYEPEILSHFIGITNSSSSIIPNSVTKSGSLILITQARTETSNDIMELIDVSNPSLPHSVGIFQSDTDPYDIIVKDTIGYLATNDGLEILDISNPASPNMISSILNSARSVTYQNPYIYSSTSTFYVINVDDPENPYIISSLQTHTSSGDIDLFILEKYAYWADRELGMIDISNPENPLQITTFDGKDRGRGVAAKENKIFFADNMQGVWILRNNLITNVKNDIPFLLHNYELYQSYPNPFNATTIIEFSLPQKDNVIIEVFDVLGRRIKTLLKEEMNAGKYKVEFNASSLSSGVYFYSIASREFYQTKKMILLR
jgi:hypothetical protein